MTATALEYIKQMCLFIILNQNLTYNAVQIILVMYNWQLSQGSAATYVRGCGKFILAHISLWFISG